MTSNVIQLSFLEADRGDLISAQDLAATAGITYRQLDFWTRAGVLGEAIPANGSGSRRRFDRHELARATLIKRLLDGGLTLRAARIATDDLLASGRTLIAGMTLELPEQL